MGLTFCSHFMLTWQKEGENQRYYFQETLYARGWQVDLDAANFFSANRWGPGYYYVCSRPMYILVKTCTNIFTS